MAETLGPPGPSPDARLDPQSWPKNDEGVHWTTLPKAQLEAFLDSEKTRNNGVSFRVKKSAVWNGSATSCPSKARLHWGDGVGLGAARDCARTLLACALTRAAATRRPSPTGASAARRRRRRGRNSSGSGMRGQRRSVLRSPGARASSRSRAHARRLSARPCAAAARLTSRAQSTTMRKAC